MSKPKFVSIHQGTAHGGITLPEERRLIGSRRRNFYIEIWTNSYMQSFHTRFLSALFTMYTSFEVPTQHIYSIDIRIDILICIEIQD